MQVFRMRTGSQNHFPAILKEENTQTNTAEKGEAHDRPVGICPSVHLTRRAWSLSLVQCRLSWSHSVIFPFHGPPFPRHPARDVNPCRFWWSQVRAISPTQNASFSMKVSGEPYFHILCVWSTQVHLSEMQQPLSPSLFLQMRAWAALVSIRCSLSMLRSTRPLPPPLPSWLKEIPVRSHCCCVCEGLWGSRQLVL